MHVQNSPSDIISLLTGRFRGRAAILLPTRALCTLLLALAAPAGAETYYVDSESGNDSNSGTSPDAPWKTLKKISRSRFAAGDTILLRRDRHWRETLVVSSSGSPERPILFSSYGSGSKPVIMRTEAFSDWTLTSELDKGKEGKKMIWGGRLPGLENSWGMVWKGLRVPSLRQYAGISVEDLSNGYFYAPLNSERFYFRNDSGEPGLAEIGARKEAIRIRNRSNVVINGIDVFGPGGRQTRGGATGFKAVSVDGDSHDITLRNISITHGNGFAVWAAPTTRNISYINLTVSDNGSTGIYMNSQGGTITGCKSYNNGRLATDKGDRGGIGSYKGSDLIIESNEVFNNGPEDGDADFEISMVGTGPVTIVRNHVHDCLQGCIQIAEGGDNSLIAYNIISRYGSAGRGRKSSPGHNSGIRIGGGRGGAKGVRIYNNILHGGRQPAGAQEAALYVGPYDNSGLDVRNNIFVDNSNRSIYVRSKAILENARFSNNLFSNLSNTLNWKEKALKTLQHWRTASGQGRGSVVGNPLFLNNSGTLSRESDFALQAASPAIDRGADVGLASDYDGNPVPNGMAPDIGAFEFYPRD